MPHTRPHTRNAPIDVTLAEPAIAEARLPAPLRWLARELRDMHLVLEQLEELANDPHGIGRAARAEAIYSYLLISFSLFRRDADALLDTIRARVPMVNGEARAVAEVDEGLHHLPQVIDPVFAGLKNMRSNGLPPNPDRFAVEVFVFTAFVSTRLGDGTWRLMELAAAFLEDDDFSDLSRDIALHWGTAHTGQP